MTKKKGIASKLFIGLTGLTLLSCCFLGTTFARYTSGGSGTAEVGVALWDVSAADEFESTLDTENADISPSMEVYKEGSANRTNTSALIPVVAITNNGDVSATITIDSTIKGMDFTFVEKAAVSEFGEGFEASKNPTQDEVEELFTAAISLGDDANGTDATVATEKTIAPDEVVYVFVAITWTSQDGKWGSKSDVLDTWVGQYIANIKFTFGFTAVQASEIPDSTVGG